MGMYDTFNGFQEKVFPWYTYDDFFKEVGGNVYAHNGDLKYYNSGSSVPYRSLSRNYTKNFVILDIEDIEELQIILHIIEDGVLVDTIELKDNNTLNANEYLEKTNLIISGYGDLLNNIHSVDDIKSYIIDLKETTFKIREIKSNYNYIIQTNIQILTQIRDAKKGNKEEESERLKKVYIKNKEKEKKELKKITPKLNKLNNTFKEKWLYSNVEYFEYENFGAWVESGLFYIKKIESFENDKEKIKSIEEQMSYYKNDFLKRFEEKLQSEDFMKGYFEWCKATEEEKNNVKRLFKEIAVNAKL